MKGGRDRCCPGIWLIVYSLPIFTHLGMIFLVLLLMYTETLSSWSIQCSHSPHLCLSSPCQWLRLISSPSSRHSADLRLQAPKHFLASPKCPSFELTTESMETAGLYHTKLLLFSLESAWDSFYC